MSLILLVVYFCHVAVGNSTSPFAIIALAHIFTAAANAMFLDESSTQPYCMFTLYDF